MKRHIGDRTEQFVEWTPEDMYVIKQMHWYCLDWFVLLSSCPGEWMKSSDIKLKPKHVPISELNATQLNRLLPPIYAYRPSKRGQRKRSIISALPSK
jgi:hypothetical protein